MPSCTSHSSIAARTTASFSTGVSSRLDRYRHLDRVQEGAKRHGRLAGLGKHRRPIGLWPHGVSIAVGRERHVDLDIANGAAQVVVVPTVECCPAVDAAGEDGRLACCDMLAEKRERLRRAGEGLEGSQ